MQALCQWEAQRDESAEALADLLAALGASSRVGKDATDLVRTFWARRKRIDKLIASAADQWALSRISMVERNIMRVAVVELAHGETPSKVAINEAIEIGREFGGEDSPRFINGVLDRIVKDMSKDDA